MTSVKGYNDFYESAFNEMCKELEAGETITIYIDCIGHTRACMVEGAYARRLEKKYGDRLQIGRDKWGFDTYTLEDEA